MIRSVLVLGLALLALPARAEWILDGEEVPVARLDANLTRRLKEKPDDAAAHAALARILSFAWAKGSEQVRVEFVDGDEGVPRFPPWTTVRPTVDADLADSKARRTLFMRSIWHYRRAVRLDPKNAANDLGLGWMLETGNSLAVALGRPDGSEVKTRVPDDERFRYRTWIEQLGDDAYEKRQSAARSLRENLARAFGTLIEARTHEDVEIRASVGKLLRRRWDDFALEAYRKAYALRHDPDLKLGARSDGIEESIALEAGRGILRIFGRRPEAERGATTKELDAIRASVAKLAALPEIVTPVVIGPVGAEGLSELIDDSKTVTFDLDGDGRPGRWPWLRPSAGLLVWDPERSGRVDSGRRLFGSVTWWMFWRHGYEPLAALDDDGDGRLTERELAGLSVWFDRDGDAVSDAGEVVSVESLNIVALEVSARRGANGVLGHARGVVYRDGTSAPTWDWCPTRR